MSLEFKNNFSNLKDSVLVYSTNKLPTELVSFFEENVDFDSKTKKYEKADSTFGRAEVIKLVYETQNYVVRIYKRGGIVRSINKSLFGKNIGYPLNSRPVFEYNILCQLRKSGIKVPQVISCLVKSRFSLFYQGALITKEIVKAENLLSLMIKRELDILEIAEYCFLAGKEVRKVLEMGILHVDLHPGNVLISNGSAFLIDFDKAKKFENYLEIKEADLSFLTERWNRAVNKRVEQTGDAQIWNSSFVSGLKGPI